tara:strand:- start:10200 stop:10454 length:255 start_codon:yes stop_codon:yes gene_type:complete
MFNDTPLAKNLQGTPSQQMWEILRAHELRINAITEHLKLVDEETDVDVTDVEKHVSGLKGNVKNSSVKKGRGGKNVTLSVSEEN